MKSNSKLGIIGTAVIATSLFVSPSAIAQKGMWEMSLAGSIDSQSSTISSGAFSSTTDSTNTFINASVGKYFTPKFVGKINVAMFGTDSAGSTSVGTSAGVGVKLYFGEAAQSKWIPFIQGGLNIVMFDGGTYTASGAGVVGGGGVSHFLTEEVSLDLSAQAYFDSMTADTAGSPTVENSGTRILFGITARY